MEHPVAELSYGVGEDVQIDVDREGHITETKHYHGKAKLRHDAHERRMHKKKKQHHGAPTAEHQTVSPVKHTPTKTQHHEALQHATEHQDHRTPSIKDISFDDEDPAPKKHEKAYSQP